MNRQQTHGETQQSSPPLETRHGGYEGDIGQLNTEGVLDDEGEDGLDLEGYEEYLEQLKSKATVRPCSARIVRHMPADPSQFFMANADNPIPTRPARPISARPRMRSTPRNPSSNGTSNNPQLRSSGAGIRRKRQGEKLVHARIRAVYSDVGRLPLSHKQTAALSAAGSINLSQEADLHDEYYRLLDAESELKAAYLQEQQKRVKATAHVRRLEEIIAMKDKKIESLLHAKAVGGDRFLSTSRTVAQRELAERDRQFHSLVQRLKQKISQQSQLISSYEEAMQSLRSGMKNTNLMELEEERCQLYQELSHHKELMDRQRLEWESHQQKLLAFAEAEANNKFQLSKLQQENKVILHEKRKLEQEAGFLKSQVELLQSNLALEQRKRTYDREFRNSVGKHSFSSSSTQKVMLAQALEEMKKLMRRESIASIRREKLKSPTVPHRPEKNTYPAPPNSSLDVPATPLAPKTPTRVSLTSPRPVSAVPTHSIEETSLQGPINSERGNRSKIDVIPAADATSVLRCPPEVKHQANLAEHDKALVSTVQANKLKPDNHEEPRMDTVPCSMGAGSASTIPVLKPHLGKLEQMSSTSVFQPCTPEADPGGDQQADSSQANESSIDQIADEEMAEIQLQKLAEAESALRLDVGNEIDSESSADLLDDAQHPMLVSGAETPSSADTELLEFGVLKGRATGTDFTMSPISADDGGLDDLYPSDFADADAQTSADDETQDEGEEEAWDA